MLLNKAGREQKLRFFSLFFLGILPFASSNAFSHSLSLQQAERIALAQSPEIQSFRAKNQALYQAAIAAGQLPDPKLFAGAINVPVDSFNFNQERMTQIQLGLGQAFPRGKSLHYKMLEQKRLSEAELYKLQAMRLDILKKVRLSWLHLYYWQHTKKIVVQQKKIFRNLLEVAKSMLANNKAQQKDVIRAQLELSELEHRLIQMEQQIQTARLQLSRWITEANARNAQTTNKPRWLALASKNRLREAVKQHPELKADSANISAQQAKVKLALQQYKPGFDVNLKYGLRNARDEKGKKWPDFLTASVNMDFPVFPHNRQDRTLKSSEQNLLAHEQDRMSHYRNLRQSLNIQYAIWQLQQKSSRLYTDTLIPQAKHYARATMSAYQNYQTDFPTLSRAYVLQLNTEIEGLKTLVERDTARINLLYLQGK